MIDTWHQRVTKNVKNRPKTAGISFLLKFKDLRTNSIENESIRSHYLFFLLQNCFEFNEHTILQNNVKTSFKCSFQMPKVNADTFLNLNNSIYYFND